MKTLEKTMTEFDLYIEEMKNSILQCLSKLDKDHGYRKWYISKNTGINIEVLTVLLKQLKNEGKVELMMIWSERTGLPNGSGYKLTDNFKL